MNPQKNQGSSAQIFKNKKVIFTTGGSGGHIQTALAVLASTPKLKPITLFVGSTRTMEGEKAKISLEQELCQRMGIDFVAIRSGKLQRSFSLRSIELLLGVPAGFFDALKLLNRVKPQLVVSFGGYVSLPVVVAAYFKRIPTFIHEQTTCVGLANKMASKFANKILISYPQSKQFFPAHKVVFTGSPTQPHIASPKISIKKADPKILKKIKLLAKQQDQFPIITVYGGSQGSHLLNQNIKPVLSKLLENYQLIIQTGDNQIFNDYSQFKNLINELKPEYQERIYLTKFLYEELGYVNSITDISISRAGANRVYELGMSQVPSLLVPIPWVTNNEQYKNSKILADLGLGKILEEKSITPIVLFNEINQFFRSDDQFSRKNVNKLKEDKNFKQKIKELFPADADKKIGKMILKELGLPRRGRE